MLVENYEPFDAITNCSSVKEWLNESVSNAFYLGYRIQNVQDFLLEYPNPPFTKSLTKFIMNAHKYTQRIVNLADAYLSKHKRIIVLHMVNDVLNHIDPDDDIMLTAYTLGVYIDCLSHNNVYG